MRLSRGGIRTIVAGLLVALLVPTLARAQDRPTGLIFADEETYRSIPLAATPLLGVIPESVDLTPDFPEPGNQRNQGSCVGWAVAYGLKSYQEQVERKWGFGSDRHIFSPAYIYNQIKLSGCMGGAKYIDALNLVRREGVASWADFPYDPNDCDRRPTVADKQAARAFAIADWRRVNVQDETEIKIQLAAGFPVLIGMMVDQAFKELGPETYESYSGQNLGGHAVVFVGYSESRQAFMIYNSWGDTWGDDGIGWISYRAARETAREGYMAQDIVAVTPHPVDDEDPPPPPPPAKQTQVSVGMPQHWHNVPVALANGFGSAPGMSITVPGTITDGAGRMIQIVVKFNYQNGPPLFANPQELNYRDTGGLVATGTPVRPVGSDSENLSGIPITIPYYALNFPATGGQRNYQLTFTAYVYVDNQILAQSMAVPFGLVW